MSTLDEIVSGDEREPDVACSAELGTGHDAMDEDTVHVICPHQLQCKRRLRLRLGRGGAS